MMKQRQCGCDCRDTDQVFAGVNPNGLCCPTCSGLDRPCCYVAHFGCSIPSDLVTIPNPYPTQNLTPPRSTTHTESKDGDVYLRVLCAQENVCQYVSVFVSNSNAFGCLDHSGAYNYYANQDIYDDAAAWGFGATRCTWKERTLCADGPAVFQRWKLDLSLDPITLAHTEFDIEYSIAADEWDCGGPNTMVMTVTDDVRSDGGFIQLPNKVCVTPLVEEDHDHCDENLPCGYASDVDRCACGDDCCDLPVSFDLVCGEETATIAGTTVASDVAGTCAPAGRSVMLEGTVTFGGTDYDIKFVMYCDGTDWLVDVYCDAVLDQSCLVSVFTKCPFSATVTIPELSCMVCEPPTVETDCCPDDDIPETLTATIVGSGACSTCVDSVIEIVWNGTEWTGTTGTLNCVLADFTITIKLKCVGTDWQIAIETTCATTWPYQNVVGVTCNPFEAARSVSLDDCCDTGSAGLTVTITA